MRRLLFLFCLLLPLAAVAGPSIEYHWGHPGPQGNAIFGLCFADDLQGWAVARGGAVLHSTDGGDTWELQREWSPDRTDLYDIERLSTGTLIASGELGRVARSLDGGVSWQSVQTPASGDLRDLCLRPDGSISASGENGAVVVSVDDGQTWSDVGPGFGLAEHHLWRSTLEGYVVGLELAHRTVDGGSTWSAVFPPVFGGLNEVFVAGGDSLVITHDFGHWHSEDGGLTWNEITRFVPPFYSARSVVLDSQHWINTMHGEGGEVWETFDAGATWTQRLVRDCVGFPAIERLPNGRLIVASDVGDLMTSDDGGMTYVQRSQNLCGDGASSAIARFVTRPDGVVFAATEVPRIGPYNWMRSIDGVHWEKPADWPDVFRVHGGAFHDDAFGLVSGFQAISRTYDGGVTWEDLAIPVGVTSASSVDLTFRDRIYLVAGVSAGSSLLRSRDDGTSWETVGGGLPSNFDPRTIAMRPDGLGLCGGEQAGVPRVFRSADGGDTWSPTPWAGWQPMDFDWVDDQVVFAADGNRLWRSANAGLSWQVSDAEWVTHVAFVDSMHGVSFRRWFQGFRLTDDGGTTWTPVDAPFRGADPDRSVYEAITAVVARPGSGVAGWLIGADMNRILVADLSPSTAAPPIVRPMHGRGVEIQSASPNPFNPRVIVRYLVERGASIQLSVYDVRGRRVRDLGVATVGAGVHEVLWDGTDDHGGSVASGTYVVRAVTAAGWDAVKVGLVR